MDEFALIADWLAPLAAERPGAFELTDDAASIAVPSGHEMVVTADALVAGVHFREHDSPNTAAARALRTNLSDLAAMGAKPYGYMLTLALPPGCDAGWMAAFTERLARDQSTFGIGLLGGDTVATPGPLTVAVTALGFVESGQLLRRSGARPGDMVCVSGTIGDAALALKVAGAVPALQERFRLPEPRLALGRALIGCATAAIDISDGLVADLGHLCRASGVGARVGVATVPLSAAGRACLRADPSLIETVLTGGDDYELLFTMPQSSRPALTGLPERVSEIGVIESGREIVVHDAKGARLSFPHEGWRHLRVAEDA